MPKIDLKNLDKSDWKTYRFDQIVKNISERVEPGETDLEIYIGLEHIDAESIHIKRFGQPSDVEGQKLKCYPGDVIFGKRRAYQRKASVVTTEAICSAHAFVLRANPKVIDPKLLPFFLHSDLFMHRAVDISAGGLSPTINWGVLKIQEFLLPPKEQQAELAELLWAMDEVIEKDLAVLEKLELYNLSHTSEIYQKISVDVNNMKKLVDIADFIDYRGKTPCKTEHGIRLITAKNIRDGWIDQFPDEFIAKEDYESWMTRGIPANGDVLFTTEAPLGNTAIVNFNERFALAQRVVCLHPKNGIDSEYLHFALNTPTFKSKLLSMATGTTVFGIRSALLKEIEIPVPAPHIQTEIKISRSTLIVNSNRVKSKISASKALQKSLINEVF